MFLVIIVRRVLVFLIVPLKTLFFILYVNEILISVPRDALFFLADDTAVVTSGGVWREVLCQYS